MEGSFSPILRKVAGDLSKPKRSVAVPTEIFLEEWWLSKPRSGQGIAVSGRPVEIKKSDDALGKFDFTPSKSLRAYREFQSAQIVKRHGCTTVESSDGSIIFLCGFVNKFRTQENGFSYEICRDFIYGFPFDWDDYAAQSSVKESGIQNDNLSMESFSGATLDLYNGAQLHDLVLSLNETQREQFRESCYNDLLQMFDPLAEHDTVQDSWTPARVLELGTPDHEVTQSSKKRQKIASPENTEKSVAFLFP